VRVCGAESGHGTPARSGEGGKGRTWAGHGAGVLPLKPDVMGEMPLSENLISVVVSAEASRYNNNDTRAEARNKNLRYGKLCV
jgi:hypothetical protein